jgi:hypothetical protein
MESREALEIAETDGELNSCSDNLLQLCFFLSFLQQIFISHFANYYIIVPIAVTS